jgi:hypothetical protein
LLDEIGFAHALERGEPRDFLARQTHLPRPATTGRATLTFIKNRHAGRLVEPEFQQNEFSFQVGQQCFQFLSARFQIFPHSDPG